MEHRPPPQGWPTTGLAVTTSRSSAQSYFASLDIGEERHALAVAVLDGTDSRIRKRVACLDRRREDRSLNVVFEDNGFGKYFCFGP